MTDTNEMASNELNNRALKGLLALDKAINPPFQKTGGFQTSRFAPNGYENFVLVIEASTYDKKIYDNLRAALTLAGATGHVIYRKSKDPAIISPSSLGEFHICFQDIENITKLKQTIIDNRKVLSSLAREPRI